MDRRCVLATTNTFLAFLATLPIHLFVMSTNTLVATNKFVQVTFAPRLTDLVLLTSCNMDSHGWKIGSYLSKTGYQPIHLHLSLLIICFLFFAPFLYQLSILRHANISNTTNFEMDGFAVMKMIHCLYVITSLLPSKTSILIMSLCMNHAAV